MSTQVPPSGVTHSTNPTMSSIIDERVCKKCNFLGPPSGLWNKFLGCLVCSWYADKIGRPTAESSHDVFPLCTGPIFECWLMRKYYRQAHIIFRQLKLELEADEQETQANLSTSEDLQDYNKLKASLAVVVEQGGENVRFFDEAIELMQRKSRWPHARRQQI